METIRHRITRRCKDFPWIPFSEEELKAVRKRWKNSKACGPDSISHESLKILEQDDRWRSMLLYVFNDMLYTAAIPSCIEKGITVLLAKTTVPGDWSDTRPITLSSTLLRSFSQLIIGRASHLLQGDSRLQWSRKSRQGVELILILRRLCRVAHDWGLPMFLAKLDIRKAFDSIFQEAMAEQIEEDVSINGGMPWEARAWISLVHANEMEIVFREEHFRLPQSNGVRQGSPDSPIAFGRIVAKDLEKSLAEAKHAKPTSGEPPPEDGGCFMDDSYLWSTSATHLQTMLNRVGANLPKKGLDIHPVKTEIIDNQEGGTPFKVAGKTVLSKGADHVIRVLGSPLNFRGQPSIIVAEMQTRARKAFAKHRGTLMSNAPLKSRLQMHTVLVRQSALWACETWGCMDFILKCANSTQLMQARNMLKTSRGAGEQWHEWNIRCWGLTGHASRGDKVGAAMMRWRNLKWWRIEQTIPPAWGGHRHSHRFNPHLDVERQIAAVAGEDWQTIAEDRFRWANMEDTFVAKFDIPWASGEQAQIGNLIPNQDNPEHRDSGQGSTTPIQTRHTPSDSPREPTRQQQPPWAQHESPQPNPAFASNPPWSLTHEQAANLLAESPTIHAQTYKQDEQAHNQEPDSPPPLPPPNDAPPGLTQATTAEQHTSSGGAEGTTERDDTSAPAENTHSQWDHSGSPEEAMAPSTNTYWDPQWGTTADEPPTHGHNPAAAPTSSATTAQQQDAPQAAGAETTEGASTSTDCKQQQAPAATRPAPWADTYAKERFADLLNRHMNSTHTAQAEWAATQPDFETPPDLPPDFSLPTASGAPTEFTTLTHGCWEVRVRPAQQPSDRSGNVMGGGNQRGLPVLYVPYLGQAGPLERAPPFTRGTVGRIAPMPQGNAWLLIITSTPHLDEYEPNTMLTVEGDKFMIEASDKDDKPAANDSDAVPQQAPAADAAATDAAAGEDDSPVQWFEDYEDSPPHVPLSEHSQAEVSQLGEGRWRLAIRADKGKSTKKLAGLPIAVVEGEGGDIDSAPPLPIGLEGILEFLTEDLWVLAIELTPPHPNYEQDTMLLSPGDRLLLERTLTGWQIRVEHLDPNCPPPIRRLRQRRRETLEAAAKARGDKKAAAGTHGGERLPTIPEGSNSRGSTDAGDTSTKPAPPPALAAEQTASSSSSSSHERPQSYYPQSRKPATAATGDRPHVNTLADGRELRQSQQNRPTQPQQPSTQQQTTESTLAEALSDGRNIGKRSSRGEGTTTTTTEAPRQTTTTTTDTTTSNTTVRSAESDSSPFMQTHSSARPAARSGASALQGDDAARAEAAEAIATQEQTPTTPIASPTLETPPLQPPTASSSNASSGVHLVSLRTPTPQQMEGIGSGEPSSGSNDPRPSSRSWQRVEQKLVEIRRIAEQHNGSQAEAIAQAADTALIDLLVDTPTALQLEGDTSTHTLPTVGTQQQQQPTQHSNSAA
ncbi:Retrovirus-related Pol polyprotein from type-1 retrotransposable element R2 [Symbiodinium microadriaticum]|uniref:Retrovirus-related Pol polyprotein from type-1 retrotransposable element R2 n=1 Tax=Symbiodinium microadriaticum TaxID=2951 RepID=A0A1Q9DLS7_SYMMI|nr:Retrovirus-related Pol polyprotein from type-1 retrotransposable element R2 [Symbiodinium microadriaticum]